MDFTYKLVLYFMGLVFFVTSVTGETCATSTSDHLGPFSMSNTPNRATVCTETDPQFFQDQLVVSGHVKGRNCKGVDGVMVEIWQADSSGEYDPPTLEQYSAISWNYLDPESTQEYTCRSHVLTDSTGAYSFTTVMPGYYPGRPRHLHYRVTTPSQTSVHQMYFDTDSRAGKIASLTVSTDQVSANVKSAVFNVTIDAEGTYDFSGSGTESGNNGSETGNNTTETGNNTTDTGNNSSDTGNGDVTDPSDIPDEYEQDMKCYSCDVCPEPFDAAHSSVKIEQCPPHGCRAWKNDGFNHWSRGCLLSPECNPSNAAYTAICCDGDKCNTKTTSAAPLSLHGRIFVMYFPISTFFGFLLIIPILF